MIAHKEMDHPEMVSAYHHESSVQGWRLFKQTCAFLAETLKPNKSDSANKILEAHAQSCRVFSASHRS